MSDAVTVADKDVLTIEGVSGTMAGSLEGLLVALDDKVSTSEAHIMTLTIEIRTFDILTTTYGHTIGTFCTLTAIIPRNK